MSLLRNLTTPIAALLVTVTIAPAAFSAKVAAPPTPDTAGLFFRSDSADGLFAAPVLSSDVEIEVTGDVARVTVTQRFHNPSQLWLEGIYVFPLPERAAVDRLRMRIGERVVEGRILEKTEAETAYRAALKAGKRASLLSSARPNVFSTKLANIGPGEEIVVEIGYQDRAPFADGGWSYRFPLVVTPRYTPTAGLPLVAVPPSGPGFRDATPKLHRIVQRPVADAARDLFGPVRHPADGSINPVSLAVRFDAGVPVSGISSATHDIDIARDDERSARVALRAGPVASDRDFVLIWRPVAADRPRVGLFAEERDGATHLMVTLVPPDTAHGAASALPRDLVLVIDKSGSMHGPAIAGARRAAALALDALTPQDRFNLIVFDSHTASLFPGPRVATAQNLDRAQRAIAALEANGGTEMAGALTAALLGQAPAGRLRQIVFLTDGAVSNEHALAEMIEHGLGSSRLFTVGVGSAPNSFFMRRAAEAGRGTFTHIDDTAEVLPRMAALLRKLARPALTDIAIDWQVAAAAGPQIYPAPIPDLYIGEPVSLVARFADLPLADLHGAVTIAGTAGGERWSQTVSLDDVAPADGVAGIWGRSKVASLRNAYPLREPDFEAMRRAVIDTALDYWLVTEFTSLVAIDESEVARPPEADVRPAEIERNLPRGMDHAKVFGKTHNAPPAGLVPVPAEVLQDAALRQAIGLPQTATPAPALLAGGAILVLSGLLLCVARLPVRKPSHKAAAR